MRALYTQGLDCQAWDVPDLKSKIRQFCNKYCLRLNTDLGQHFLVDTDVLEKIVNTAQIEKSDHIVEIGPGIGVLTKELLAKAGKVTAIEIDNRLIPILEVYTDEPDHLEVIQGNALEVPMPDEPYKIVANIPYHITSPLLRHAFLESKTIPTSMTLLIQREVAEKICSEKGGGILTVLVQLFGEPEIITHVPALSFLPPPKVESSVLHVRCFDKPKASPEAIEEIFRLTKLAFSQRRKMISNSIGKMDGGMELLEKAGIDSNRRPQTLSVEEWIELARSMEE